VNFTVYSTIELRCITIYYGMVPYNTISYSKVMVKPFDRVIEQLTKSDIYSTIEYDELLYSMVQYGTIRYIIL